MKSVCTWDSLGTTCNKIQQDVELGIGYMIRTCIVFFLRGCMLNSLGTSSCVEPLLKKKKTPIKPIANCATIHFPYPAGHQIPADQNKTETQTKTHTEHCPTDPLCRLCKCSPGNVTAQQIWADSPQWHSGRRQPDPLCGTLTRFNHRLGNIKYTCTEMILHHWIFVFLFLSFHEDR